MSSHYDNNIKLGVFKQKHGGGSKQRHIIQISCLINHKMRVNMNAARILLQSLQNPNTQPDKTHHFTIFLLGHFSELYESYYHSVNMQTEACTDTELGTGPGQAGFDRGKRPFW